MKPNEPRSEHIKRITERYRRSDKRTKTAILTEFCLSWNVERKHAIKLLGGKRGGPRKKAGRKPRYDDRLVRHLVVLWNSMERIHPKRMCNITAIPPFPALSRSPAALHTDDVDLVIEITSLNQAPMDKNLRLPSRV